MSDTTMTERTSDKLLLAADEAAELCGLSRSGWWGLHASGRIPLPVRLGRRTLWRADELRAWTEAGCPARDRWESEKSAGKSARRG